jgi:hypothetical protein
VQASLPGDVFFNVYFEVAFEASDPETVEFKIDREQALGGASSRPPEHLAAQPVVAPTPSVAMTSRFVYPVVQHVEAAGEFPFQLSANDQVLQTFWVSIEQS